MVDKISASGERDGASAGERDGREGIANAARFKLAPARNAAKKRFRYLKIAKSGTTTAR